MYEETQTEPAWLQEQYAEPTTEPLEKPQKKKRASKPQIRLLSTREQEEVKPFEAFDSVDLLQRAFEPLQWIIPGYLPEGLTLLFARPKVGKSMLSLALSLRMARRTSGGVDGAVLYLTLDDTSERRLQDRTRSLLQGAEIERGRLWFATQAQALDTGLIEQLALWMQAHPDTRLVVVDVYARIKPKKKDDDVFKSDYDALILLQEFAVKHHIAVLLTHHTRKKNDTEDWIDSCNGSTGLTAAVDTLWTLERRPSSNDLTLRVKGRDTMGELAVGLSLDDLDAPWKVEGEEEGTVNASEQKILAVLRTANTELAPKKITELTGVKHSTVLGTLRRMLHKNLVAQTAYGSYQITGITKSSQPFSGCNSVILASEYTSEATPERITENYTDGENGNSVILAPEQTTLAETNHAPTCPKCGHHDFVVDSLDNRLWLCARCNYSIAAPTKEKGLDLCH